MNFDFSEEQELLRQTARRFLQQECGIPYTRAMMEDPRGYRPEIWARMAEMGWTGLAVPADRGGLGMGLLDLVVVLEEMGRLVHPGPFFSSAVFATALVLHAATEEQQKEILVPLGSGARRATVALAEETGWDLDGLATSIERRGDGYAVTGRKVLVTDAPDADWLLVVGRDGAGLSVAAVEGGAPGLAVEPVAPLDQTRKLAEVRLDGVRVDASGVLGTPAAAREAVERATDWARVGLCAEAVGGAQRVLEMSVEYAKQRVQFDRPIGSFQAVQHKLADMLRLVELARVATYYAAWALQQGADAPAWASLAKAYVGEAYARVAADGIQVHGGIGFTWEHDLHLYYKRAKAIEYLLGDPQAMRERCASLVL